MFCFFHTYPIKIISTLGWRRLRREDGRQRRCSRRSSSRYPRSEVRQRPTSAATSGPSRRQHRGPRVQRAPEEGFPQLHHAVRHAAERRVQLSVDGQRSERKVGQMLPRLRQSLYASPLRARKWERRNVCRRRSSGRSEPATCFEPHRHYVANQKESSGVWNGQREALDATFGREVAAAHFFFPERFWSDDTDDEHDPEKLNSGKFRSSESGPKRRRKKAGRSKSWKSRFKSRKERKQDGRGCRSKWEKGGMS